MKIWWNWVFYFYLIIICLITKKLQNLDVFRWVHIHEFVSFSFFASCHKSPFLVHIYVIEMGLVKSPNFAFMMCQLFLFLFGNMMCQLQPPNVFVKLKDSNVWVHYYLVPHYVSYFPLGNCLTNHRSIDSSGSSIKFST